MGAPGVGCGEGIVVVGDVDAPLLESEGVVA